MKRVWDASSAHPQLIAEDGLHSVLKQVVRNRLNAAPWRILKSGLLTSIRRFRAALAAPLTLMPILLEVRSIRWRPVRLRACVNEDVFLYRGMGRPTSAMPVRLD